MGFLLFSLSSFLIWLVCQLSQKRVGKGRSWESSQFSPKSNPTSHYTDFMKEIACLIFFLLLLSLYCTSHILYAKGSDQAFSFPFWYGRRFFLSSCHFERIKTRVLYYTYGILYRLRTRKILSFTWHDNDMCQRVREAY